MNYPFEIKISSERETAELAEKFASGLKGGEVVILNGELGSGKTFFIKYAAAYFEIKNAGSPSFAIVNEYNGKKKIFHFDFYRIKKAVELYNIGFSDYLNDLQAIIFIEWGNLFKVVLPRKRIEININVVSDTGRKFEFRNYE